MNEGVPDTAGGGAHTPEARDRDAALLLPYVRLQAAAAAGNISPQEQVAVMQRLVLLLLPIFEGCGPTATFLRCIFFKKPLPPIHAAYMAGRYSAAGAAAAAAAAEGKQGSAAGTHVPPAAATVESAAAAVKPTAAATETASAAAERTADIEPEAETAAAAAAGALAAASAAAAAGGAAGDGESALDSSALALTSRLELLRGFCALYARICVRLHAISCFGALEAVVFQEEAEISSVETAWGMLLRLGPQQLQQQEQQQQLQQGGEGVLQRLIDEREDELALWACGSWPIEDMCVRELLKWEGFDKDSKSSAAAAATATATAPAAAAADDDDYAEKKSLPLSRQERLLRSLPAAVELLSTDEETARGETYYSIQPLSLLSLIFS
ncbi:hypothetical protein, conserved [Eimeria acervulina]|uniref:Uncharacterized protein n=1 Tax=Eimeria acervulina TaxID=5801 RepID=U6GD70_EIMAC|nr:hypothetical protein, conserved [Eimeria acervulina]CDI77293.1 hypothetical protein, conserved [Eimeria acervulina]